MHIKDFSSYDLVVLLCVAIVSLSGILVNFKRKKPEKNEVFKESDFSSIILFRALIPFAIIINLFFYFTETDILNFKHISIQIIGFVLFISGVIIRWTAIATLGKAFNVKVTIIKNQKLQISGIYKNIRHPSYTGLIMYYTGIALIMSNILCLIIFVFSSLTVVLFRIKIEEKLLTDYYKSEYLEYKKNSYRLFPFIY